MFIDASIASCCPLLTGRRAAAWVVAAGSPLSWGTVTVGPVPTEVATAFIGSSRLIFARRDVTVAGPPSPNARMRNLVITPSIGAPCDDGSPFGLVGTMNWTIEHDELIGSSQGASVGSFVVRRLPKLTAAFPGGANTSSDATAARGI